MELLDLKAIAIVAMIFIPLEIFFPLHPEQKFFRKHLINDLIYVFLNAMLIKVCLLLLIGAVMTGLRLAIPDSVTASVASQPLWLQTVQVIVIADLGFYLAHRAFHAIPFLWRFHAIHHSIEEMDWIAAHRVHPVDQILTKAASLIPVFALGYSGAAIAIFAFTYQWQSLLIHSNTRVCFGPFKWLFASPQFHHWHHANERQAFDKNFASQLPIIDAIGGTLFLPSDAMPCRYGTDDPVPSLYHEQLLYPLMQRAQSEEPEKADVQPL